MKHAYLFEAHTIQPYILESGKLSEMVGASEILEELISQQGPLDSVLKELFSSEKLEMDNGEFAINDHFCFARRGGGAFFLLFADPEKAQQLKKVWSLLVSGIAPGLAYSHACSKNAESQHAAIEGAKKIIRQQRNHLVAELPEASPWLRRSPRTGNPAVATIMEQGKTRVWVDKGSVIKQKERYRQGKKLSKKFLRGEYLEQHFQFPLNLEHDPEKKENTSFPFINDNHNLGVIHADGNGLGEILISLADNLDENSDQYAEIFYELSKKIDKATQQSARRALEPVIKKHCHNIIPARPLILGGDDLTIIVRADLALEYARDFITFFEQETKQELEQLHKKYSAIPAQMTACAGIAFIRSNQPFSLAYALAESLCSAAKKQSRQYIENNIIPGSLVFHRVTSSCIDEYEHALARELTAKHLDTEVQLTLGAYGVGQFGSKLPSFGVLEQLKNLFVLPEMAKGPTRQFLTLVSIDLHEAKDSWSRWRKTMTKKGFQEKLREYDDCTQQLEENMGDELLFSSDKLPDETNKQVTFIGDLINWIAAAGEQSEGNDND